MLFGRVALKLVLALDSGEARGFGARAGPSFGYALMASR